MMRLLSLRTLAFCLLLTLPYLTAAAKENVDGGRRGAPVLRTSNGCLPATSTSTLDINNVRTLLQNGGDMWWDLVGQPRYEVPKQENPADARHSLFAGSLWIGGVEAGTGQLRIAAQTYRQGGNDFFPGPLRIEGASTTEDLCEKWDRHYKITKTEIDNFRSAYQQALSTGGSVDASLYPNVFAWPGTNSDPGFERDLAPFVDLNDNERYEPDAGEYPEILGDQAVWWVINDKGNIHTETNGEQIGVEIQVLAFAFSTTNEINNMTFYQYKVINRSSFELEETYIGQWVDADLGYAFNDYVGCDTVRGLGICYNGTPIDEPLTQGYGAKPPAIGVDFFQGPLSTASDGIDNDKDGTVDELEYDPKSGDSLTERIGMSKFLYYNNDFSIIGNPEQATHYYGYLIGLWKNGALCVDDRTGNGNGFPDPGEQAEPTNYMFPDYPGNSCEFAQPKVDPIWDEKTAGNIAADRRFIQSAGPFNLTPGKTDDIIIGVVWARDQNNIFDLDQLGSYCALLRADDVAQALFDSGFDLLDGPDAPDLEVVELDKKLILTWDYERLGPTANNYYENYSENDPILRSDPTIDSEFEFEGYIVYQLIDGSVSAAELNDPNKARLITQCDLKNDVTTIVNRSVRTISGLDDPIITDEVMVEGKNNGITHTLEVVEDAFSEGSGRQLVNYRTYYFTVIAYAHNDTSSDGRLFVPGNGNFKRYTAMPHKTEFQDFGTIISSDYGDSPEITQVSGRGNGGNFLALTQASEDAIVANGSVAPVVYRPDSAPIQVNVVNPLEVKPFKYRVEVVRDKVLRVMPNEPGETDVIEERVDWEVYNMTGGKELVYQHKYLYNVDSNKATPTPLDGEEKYILQTAPDEVDHGISIAVSNVNNPGITTEADNGYIGSSIKYEDPSKAWLSPLPDFDNVDMFNWIRSGPICDPDPKKNTKCSSQNEDYWDRWDTLHRANKIFDPERVYANILGGTWAPWCLAANFNIGLDIIGPALYIKGDLGTLQFFRAMDAASVVNLSQLPNVDVVFTSDPAQWSRCAVVETSPTKGIGSGAQIMAAKWRRNISKDDILNKNIPIATPTSVNDSYGMSWFPGYAVNVDNGQRLAVYFGESTWHRGENGDDMMFNPTSEFGIDGKAVGGRHYLYVTNQPYPGENDEAELWRNLRISPNYSPPTTVDAARPIAFVDNPEVPTDTAFLAPTYQTVAWTTIAMTEQQWGYKYYSELPSNARVSLRVQRELVNDPSSGEIPSYEFDMTPLSALLQQKETAVEALDIINVVPNPYYARTGTGRGRYELSQLDQRVKITNLPSECTIKIYSLSGTVVRTFKKNNDSPEQQWDMKNDYGVPIASGLYIIHIDAPDLGEKILKFYAVMPELDLNAY